MENQHRKIIGYRELTQEEINLMNQVKSEGEKLSQLWHQITAMPDTDQRAASIARTHLQTGMMWLTRAIAKPAAF